MNRRKFFIGLGAALLLVPFLPSPIKNIATKWTHIGKVTFEVTYYDDSTSVKQVGDIVWEKVPETEIQRKIL